MGKRHRLGSNQLHCLKAVIDHGGWQEKTLGNWVWGSRHRTLQIMCHLRDNGLVVQRPASESVPFPTWVATKLGVVVARNKGEFPDEDEVK